MYRCWKQRKLDEAQHASCLSIASNPYQPRTDAPSPHCSYLRRIDLLSKLLAPLFVSLLTTAASNTFAAAFLLGMAAASMTFEFICAFPSAPPSHFYLTLTRT